MAETKGLIIEIGADTSKMNKAIKQLQSPLKKLQSELKYVDKALKLNPKNTDLLRQKMKLLKDAVKQADSNVDRLKASLQQMRANNAPAEQIRRLERELVMAEAEAKKMRKELALFSASQTKIGKLGSSFTSLGNKMRSVGNSMRSVSLYAGAMVGGLAAAGYKAAVFADDMNTLSAQTGVATGTLQKFSAVSDLVDVSVNSMAKGQSKIVKAMAKGGEAFEKYGIKVKNSDGSLRSSEDVFFEFMSAMGDITNETERAAAMQEVFGAKAYQALMPLAANQDQFQQYIDRLNELNLVLDQETLDSINKVNDKIDWMKSVGTLAFYKIGSAIAEALGPSLKNADEVIANIANKIANLNPVFIKVGVAIGGIITVATPLLIVLGGVANGIGSILTVASRLSGIMGGLGGGIGSLAGNFTRFLGPVGLAISAFILLWKHSKSFREAVKELGTEVGEALKPAFESLKPLLSALAPLIASIARVMGSVLAVAIKALTPIIKLLAKAFTAIVTPITSAVTKIIGGITKLMNKAKEMSKPFSSARDTIKGALNKIKNLFPLKIGKILSAIKLPHFKVSGGKAPWGFGGKGKMPSVDIKWYKKGGIIDGASVIGVGEAGPEAVVPLSGKQMQPFAEAIAKNLNGGEINYELLASAIVNAMAKTTVTTNVQIDGKTVAKTTAPYMQNQLNSIQARSNRMLGFV